MILWVRNSGGARLGSSHCRVSHTVAVRCQLGLDIQDSSLTWLAVGTGHWLGAQVVLLTSVLCMASPAWQSQGSWMSYMAVSFLQSKCPKRARQKIQGLLWPSLRSHTASPLLNSTGHKKQPIFKVRKHRPPPTTSQWEECWKFCSQIFKIPQRQKS